MSGMNRTFSSSGATRPEATLHRRFLPGCRACGSRHPLAIDPRADPSRCMLCAAPMPLLDDGETVPAVVTGIPAAIGRLLLRIGAWLRRRTDPKQTEGDF